MYINFKLYAHRHQTRPFNYTYEVQGEVNVERAEHILAHGYDFHLHLTPGDKVLLALARPEGEHLLVETLTDLNYETLDRAIPEFLEVGLRLTHEDLKHLLPTTPMRLVPRDQIITQIGDVRNDIGPVFVPLDTEGRD